MHEAGVLLDGAQFGDGHGARGADPAEVVAYEVHDHHVLGVVLGQEVGGGAAGALDGSGLDEAAVAAQVQLGRGGGDLHAVRREANRSCEGCGVASREERGEGVDVGAVRARQRRGHHPAEVGLVDLAGRDVLADAAHSGDVRGPVEGGGPLVGVGTGPGAGDGCGNGVGPYVPETRADEAPFEVGGHRPEAGGVEGGGITGDIPQVGREEAAEAGHGGQVVHGCESMTGDAGAPVR